MDYDFRHAVTLFKGWYAPLPDSPEARQLAEELLREWGEARGGTAVGDLQHESWNYGVRHGYAMNFVGKPTAPTVDTRLSQRPTIGEQILRDREEEFHIDGVAE